MGLLRGTGDFASLVAELAASPDRLQELVAGAPNGSLDRVYGDEWPARTVMAHLRDDEFLCTRLRLERMLAEERPQLTPFDEKAWAATRFTGRDGTEVILGDFRAQREATLSILRCLTPERLGRTGFQPEYGEFDVLWWLEHWVEHDRTHLEQIRAALAGH